MKSVFCYDAGDSRENDQNKSDDFRAIADFWSGLEDKNIKCQRIFGFLLNEKNEKIPMASTTESITIKQPNIEIDKILYFTQGDGKKREIRFSTIELNFDENQLKVVELNGNEHIFTSK